MNDPREPAEFSGLLGKTGEATAAAIDAARNIAFTAPTPCADFTAADLIGHFLGSADALARLGAGNPLAGDDPWGVSTRPGADWPDELIRRTRALAANWAVPAAWEGTVHTPNDLPARFAGQMAFAKLALHGWDLAATAGAAYDIDGEIADGLLELMTTMGDVGRNQGAFGPAVDIDDHASTFDRALALSGRDPAWRA